MTKKWQPLHVLWRDINPCTFRKTITFDNGHKFSDHKSIAQQLNTKVCFDHPYSSWAMIEIEIEIEIKIPMD